MNAILISKNCQEEKWKEKKIIRQKIILWFFYLTWNNHDFFRRKHKRNKYKKIILFVSVEKIITILR